MCVCVCVCVCARACMCVHASVRVCLNRDDTMYDLFIFAGVDNISTHRNMCDEYTHLK